MIKYKSTYFLHRVSTNETIEGLTLAEAKAKAEAICGNRSYARPIPGEECYILGPGDGTTECMIRREFDFIDAVTG